MQEAVGEPLRQRLQDAPRLVAVLQEAQRAQELLLARFFGGIGLSHAVMKPERGAPRLTQVKGRAPAASSIAP
jgi:hypothetical protein